ncbi:MAG: ABC transporter permease [Thermoproteota archaeon]|nr:MAG: ABC transporter permease [Candidatus Korarchaeota archaeon]
MVPITLAAIGEIIAERSGVVNIGLEGIIMLGALSSVYVGYFTGNLYLALLAGISTGIALGILHALISIYLAGDQIVVGVGLNLFAYGIGVVTLYLTWGTFANSPIIPKGAQIPKFYGFSPFVPFTIAVGIIAWYMIERTSIGLRLKAVGENPRAADSAGINVFKIRFFATLVGSVLAALGGVFLGLDWLASYTRDISAGRGFIALAMVVFSRWNPIIAVFSGLLFGFLFAISLSIPSGIVPDQVIWSIPYIATVLVAAGFVAKTRAPAALGKPYKRE